MSNSKVMKSSGTPFVKGGTGKMFGKQHASPDTPGTTGKVQNGSGGKFPSGGKTKMFGKQTAARAKPR